MWTMIASHGLSLCVYKTLSIFLVNFCVKAKFPNVSQLFLVMLHYVVKTDIAYCVLKEWDFGI
jgi:hypothetical protein